MDSGKQNRRVQGFTLMELLIVVAIIAVLVAIAIPLFTSQLERSREATDLANVRSAYAEVMVAVMSEDATVEHDGVAIKQADGSYRVVIPLVQQQDDWQTERGSLNVAGITPDDARWINKPSSGGSCAVIFNPANSQLTIDWSGGKYAFDLTTAEGQAAADNALLAEAARLALDQPINMMNPRLTRNIGSINDNPELRELSDSWYMWYYDAVAGKLLYDGVDYDGTNFESVRGHLDNNLYGYSRGHQNQAVAVAISEDGQTMLVGWTYQKVSNVYINWEQVDPSQPISFE